MFNRKSIPVFLMILVLLLASLACDEEVSTGPGDSASGAASVDSAVQVEPTTPAEQTAPNYDSMQILATDVVPDQAGFGITNGNVVSIGLLDTLRYMQAVWQNAPGTFVMRGPLNQFFVAWPMGSNWGFIGLAENGAPITQLSTFTGANKTGLYGFTDLVKELEGAGWKYVDAKQLPGWFAIAIETSTAFVAQFGAYTLDIVPAFFIITPSSFPSAPQSFVGGVQ